MSRFDRFELMIDDMVGDLYDTIKSRPLFQRFDFTKRETGAVSPDFRVEKGKVRV